MTKERMHPSDAVRFRDGYSEYLCGHSEIAAQAQGISLSNSESLRRLGRVIAKSVIVVWRSELWTAAIRGSEVFAGRTLDPTSLLAPQQFWVPDKDQKISGEGLEKMGVTSDHMLSAMHIGVRGMEAILTLIFSLSIDTEAAAIALVSAKGQNAVLPRIVQRITRLGESLDDGFDVATLAMVEFLRMPVICMRREVPSRQVRRAMERKGKELPDVRVVELRRATTQSSVPAGDVNWQWQWIVNGHWRNQWFPADKKHKPIFISPYVKGPSDRPLKPMQEPIYVVNR